jgi:hypothetical protein
MWMDELDPEDTPWNDNNELADSYLELKERGLTAPIRVNYPPPKGGELRVVPSTPSLA